jgi:hypothetical protein
VEGSGNKCIFAITVVWIKFKVPLRKCCLELGNWANGRCVLQERGRLFPTSFDNVKVFRYLVEWSLAPLLK